MTTQAIEFDLNVLLPVGGDKPVNLVPTLYESRVLSDVRGTFSEAWNGDNVRVPTMIAQANHSHNKQWALRGLHWQVPPFSLGKYVTCLFGIIQDVVVDLRKSSNTFGHWKSYILESDPETGMRQSLWVPHGFAHGFMVLSAFAEVLYFQDGFWRPESERILNPMDKDLSIDWNLERNLFGNIRISDKDLNAPWLKDLTDADLFT